jgi:hypothetical protein
MPESWKYRKTIMLFKGGDVSDQMNWRPITLTSIIYRMIFGKIAKEFVLFDDREGRTVFYREQKGFVPRISGYSHHPFMASMRLITRYRSGDNYTFER